MFGWVFFLLWTQKHHSEWEPQLAELLSRAWERLSPIPSVVLSRGGFYPWGYFKGEENHKKVRTKVVREGRLSVLLHLVVTRGNTAQLYEAGYGSWGVSVQQQLLTSNLITLHQLRVVVCIFYHGMTNTMINNYYQILAHQTKQRGLLWERAQPDTAAAKPVLFLIYLKEPNHERPLFKGKPLWYPATMAAWWTTLK